MNTALEGSDLAGKSLKELIAESRSTNAKIFNSAAQHFNHSFFWNGLSSESSSPDGSLAEAVDRDFGSLESFKEQFSTLAASHFGSGWVWLLQEGDKLVLRDYHDADTPADGDATPLLTLDVWSMLTTSIIAIIARDSSRGFGIM